MTGLDARFLYSETPAAHMHTMKVVVLDLAGRPEPLTPENFTEALRGRLDRLPLLRYRAVPVPWSLGHPMWIEDPDLDLARHLQWRHLPVPGSHRELAAVVAESAAQPLPRDRPLWDLTVVEGLEGGQVAFIMKLHHALADGGAAVALIENVFAPDDTEALVERPRGDAPPTRGELMRFSMGQYGRRLLNVPRLIRDSIRGLRAAVRTRRQAGVRLPMAFSAPRTSLNRALEPDRTFAMVDLDMADLMTVKRDRQVSLNDVFLAVCGGGLRRYLETCNDLPTRDLVAGVPVATRGAERHYRGNHVDNLMLPLGTNLADPLERLARIHEASTSARRVREALGFDLFEYRADLTPPRIYRLAIRLWARSRLANHLRPPINLVASNVRGPKPMPELEGGLLTSVYSVGPILEGIGLNVTAWSHRDTLHLSVLGSTSTLPDPWALTDALTDAAAELIAANATASSTKER